MTWAPFVGFFVALISRGRTVREVIVGGFVCPMLLGILWFSVLGGLAIKMERVAEMALRVQPELEYASVQCAEHYEGALPITPEAQALAESGYYLLSCMPQDEQLYLVMMPYVNLRGFLHVALWIGLVLYFLTSSDSGSLTDDILSASGLSAARIPSWQKVFWCVTEGLVAIALIAYSNGGALRALQRVSIIVGLPYTFVLCFMIPSLYRALKKEVGDTDIGKSRRFNTQLFDFAEAFQPRGGSPYAPLVHLSCLLTGLLVPGKAVYDTCRACYPDVPQYAVAVAAGAQGLYVSWVVLHALEIAVPGTHTVAWVSFTAFVLIVAYLRGELRRKSNVWGFPPEDVFCAMVMYPFVLAQMEMHVAADGKGAPAYFASADEIRAEMRPLGARKRFF